MVSPLSSRIYNLEAKVKIKNCKLLQTNNQNLHVPWQIESRTKRISGYTADRESEEEQVNEQKQHRSEQVEAEAKKRKVEELSFQAHNVKNDLANAGVESFVPKSKAFPKGSIDMSNVELIMSSQYSSVKAQKTDCEFNQIFLFPEDLKSTYIEMVEASKEFYKAQGKIQKKVAFPKASSITSSTTNYTTSLSSSPCDSDSEDFCSTPTPGNNSLPSLTEATETVNMCNKCIAICNLLSSSKISLISLEEALISSSPRLIVESKEPYCIVHSNASFSSLSGIPSHLLMGSSLLKFLLIKNDNSRKVDILLSEALDTTEDDYDNQVQRLDAIMPCKIDVRQVPDRGTTFSHFVMDFTKISSGTSTSTCGSEGEISKAKETVGGGYVVATDESLASYVVG